MSGPKSTAAPKARRPGMSLRARVIWAFSVIAAIVIAVAVLVTATIHAHLMNQLDDRLMAFAGPVPSEPTLPPRNDDATSPDAPLPERPSDVLRAYIDTRGELWVIYAPNVGDQDAVPQITVDQLPVNDGTGRATTVFSAPSSEGGPGFRVFARARGDIIDITAAPLDTVYASTRQLVVIQAAGIAAVLAGLALVATWVIRMGVTPMRRMVAASSAIADGELDVRLEGAGSGSESAELASALNTMIENLTSSIADKERSEARLREFVADASHELRTPLTTVLGYAQLHRRGALKRKAEATDAWTRTEAEAARMRRLVDDLLDLATYDAERPLQELGVDLLGMCAEVAVNARLAHAGAQVTVSGEPTTVVGDPDRLRQAVINVVGNALEHGGQTVDIAVSSGPTAATISVTDDGPGMAPELALRATERFVRGDASRARSTGGAGLGLSITAAIVAAHGGTLEVASEQGHGTTVTLSVPRGAH